MLLLPDSIDSVLHSPVSGRCTPLLSGCLVPRRSFTITEGRREVRLVKPDDADAKMKFLATEALSRMGGLGLDALVSMFDNELTRRD